MKPPFLGPNGLPCVEWRDGRLVACEFRPGMLVLPVAFDQLRREMILANVGAVQ